MKFYRPLLLALIEGLKLVIDDHKIASKVLESIFKSNKKWGSKDRKAFAESFYEIVKWQLLLKSIIKTRFDPDWDLLVVFYLTQKGYLIESSHSLERQSLFSDVIKFSKQISLTSHGADFGSELEIDSKSNFEFNNLTVYEKYSFSESLHKIAVEELDDVETFYKESQKEAPLFIRANSHLISVNELENKLDDEGYSADPSDHWPYGLRFRQKTNVFKSDAFKNGLFEVQDGGSQLISEFLKVEPGHFIIDACAGGGGKTLHLSNLSQNKGRILSMDVHQWKLDELKKRARRNQCHNIETRMIESTKVIKRLKDKADRLLLDVPCTGSGVFRRNPDAKYKWSDQSFSEIKELQKKILDEYNGMVKVGGKMVYSTCSAFRSENQVCVQNFLSLNENWALEEEKFISVGENGFDGYYMARLIRNH